MSLKEVLAERLKELRLKKNIKQSELGKIVGLSDNAISDIERGYRLTSIEKLEALADSFSGVERSFAIQAGREVRIIVKPEDIDDLAAIALSRDIARKVENDLDYPGQIKVVVIRETRSVEYAK